MKNAEQAASFAILAAKQAGASEVTPDHLLLGCLRAISRFGIASLGSWDLDLEALGIDWVRVPDAASPKVAYSEATVELFNRATRIAKSSGEAAVEVSHLLAAFAGEEAGLMAELKRTYGITGASWRGAVALLDIDRHAETRPESAGKQRDREREYLTPEEAAEVLGIHVQTMRGYIRSERIPAFRVAGERAIRILRSDLKKVLEPLGNEK